MFKVHVNDGQSEIPEDDICYIVAKEGIFLKKRLGVMESVAPVKNISILQSITKMAKMHINRIPPITFAKILEFLKEVYTTHYSEGIVLLFYNEKRGIYQVVPPKQKVTGASIKYDRNVTIDGFTMIGDIHSHANMSAFHSGIDDGDEKTFDGLHITLGNMGDEEISISASIVANGHRFMVSPEEYISDIKLTKDIDEEQVGYTHRIYKYIDGKMELDTEAMKRNKYSYTYRRMDKRYISLVPKEKRNFNKNWMNLVEKETSIYAYGHVTRRQAYGWANNLGGNYWGENFDPYFWTQLKPNHQIKGKPLQQQAKALPPPITILNSPEDDKCENKIPCFTCIHRNEKLLLEEDDILENVLYQCIKCGIVIDEDSDPLECPTCKTDEYLEELSEDKLEDNHIGMTPLQKAEMEDRNPIQEGNYECYSCKTNYPLFSTDVLCPFCQAFIHRDSESEKISQTRSDSASMLDEETEKANEEALRQAAAIDDFIIDPTKSKIPIPPEKKIPQKIEDKGLLAMFKKTFGKIGGNS